ncbi:hypothetical protein EBU94_04970 [bacterium]|nr:hypothetical protein [bacterium]
MEEVVILGKILGLSFFITKFAPIEWVLDLIRPSDKANSFIVLMYNLISILLGCFSCCSFWTGTLLYNFWFGISAYVIAYFYNQIIAPFVEKIRLF